MGHTFIIQHFYNLFKHEIRLLFLSCSRFPLEGIAPTEFFQMMSHRIYQRDMSPIRHFFLIIVHTMLFKSLSSLSILIGSIFEVCKINEWDLLPYSYNLSQILSVFSSFLMHNITRKGITQVVQWTTLCTMLLCTVMQCI